MGWGQHSPVSRVGRCRRWGAGGGPGRGWVRCQLQAADCPARGHQWPSHQPGTSIALAGPILTPDGAEPAPWLLPPPRQVWLVPGEVGERVGATLRW